MIQTTDILIAGAGPTGLTTAIELARRHVNVRIMERRSQPSTRSKALVVHARTLEFMDILGVADEMVQRGYTSPGIDFSANAREPLRANMYGLDTRFPFILILPQAETEAILERRLNELGVEVERSSELIQFTETPDGIRSIIERENGRFEVESQYLVGADGANSRIRQILDLPVQGSAYDWTAFLGDVHLHGHHAEGGTEQHSNDRGLAFIVPFDDGSHRIVTIDRKYQDDPKQRDLSLAELQESISAILEKQVELSDPVWLTRWGASLKLVSQYRSGRVFLGGDAVHTHSPAGGQGLNTGVQDAFNLGWKLGLVIKGQAPDTLLDTYHTERHPIGKKVLRTSDFLLRSLLVRQPLLRSLRELLFRLLIPMPLIQKNLANNLSGLGIRYNTGSGEMAGARMPDMALMTSQHEVVRLYNELLIFPGYTLLLFIDPDQAQNMRSTIEQITKYERDGLQIHIVLNNGLPELHDFGVSTLVDYRGDFETRLGFETGRALLIRPDGYIAFDHLKLDADHIGNLLKKWLTTTNGFLYREKLSRP
ncbi:FAD-dependent monooxygenase [Acaryochloris sp. CCMEE 5410]|uniref:FAD-dependent monooxygenase n=1 Tax=Acaryochloris sp. CCMEE 5410 TaxID=310037 RepID=UPI0002484A92|nr:FAD-dependent monooxygenase [Acaryochloris sp. CCMEE 5410]KAI9129115.1 FAD-dependent monooxygenase [Acaryochloris sp. CCMEE 5410]